jgi:hypothetical protein
MGGADVTPPVYGPRPAEGMWNYRVVLKHGKYAIHEVVYAADGRVRWFSADPATASGATADELAIDLRRMADALDFPPLDFTAMERDALRKADSVPGEPPA